MHEAFSCLPLTAAAPVSSWRLGVQKWHWGSFIFKSNSWQKNKRANAKGRVTKMMIYPKYGNTNKEKYLHCFSLQTCRTPPHPHTQILFKKKNMKLSFHIMRFALTNNSKFRGPYFKTQLLAVLSSFSSYSYPTDERQMPWYLLKKS